MQLAYPDLSGRYDIADLPSGRYLVALVEELYSGELYGRADFDTIVSIGMEAIAEAGTTTTLDLTVDADAAQLVRAYPSSSYSPSDEELTRVGRRRASR